MKLVKVTKKDSVKKADDHYEDLLKHMNTLINLRDTEFSLTFLGENDLDLFEGYVRLAGKNIPKVISLIRKQRKNMEGK